jgi:transcriptional regulator with XRE-family HTH domain
MTPLQIRQKTGLSQAAFSNLLGLSHNTAQRWETGQEPVGLALVLLEPLAGALRRHEAVDVVDHLRTIDNATDRVRALVAMERS